jgi:hypothetical protein
MKKLIKITLIFILLFIIFGGIIIGKKIYYKTIINKIGEAGSNLSQNYYYQYSCDDTSNPLLAHYYEKWVLNDKSKYIVENKNFINYNDYLNNITYNVNEEEKTYNMHIPTFTKEQINNSFANMPIYFNYPINYYKNENTDIDYNDFIKKIKSIKKENYNNEICYKITFSEDDNLVEVWYSTETYLIAGMISEGIEYKYTIIPNSVTEADVTFNPDKYIIQTN